MLSSREYMATGGILPCCFSCNGCNRASSEPIAKYLQDRYFWYLAYLHCLLRGGRNMSASRTKYGRWRTFCIDTGRGAAGDAGRFFHRCRPCHGISTQTKLPVEAFLTGRFAQIERVRAAYDTVSVFCHKEPGIEGRYAEKRYCGDDDSIKSYFYRRREKSDLIQICGDRFRRSEG